MNIQKQVEIELCYLERFADYLNKNLHTKSVHFQNYLNYLIYKNDCLYIDDNGIIQIDKEMVKQSVKERITKKKYILNYNQKQI